MWIMLATQPPALNQRILLTNGAAIVIAILQCEEDAPLVLDNATHWMPIPPLSKNDDPMAVLEGMNYRPNY